MTMASECDRRAADVRAQLRERDQRTIASMREGIAACQRQLSQLALLDDDQVIPGPVYICDVAGPSSHDARPGIVRGRTTTVSQRAGELRDEISAYAEALRETLARAAGR